MAWRDNGRGNLRELCESKGVEQVTEILLKTIKDKKFTLEQASLRELWEGLVGLRLERNMVQIAEPKDRKEAVATGSFVKITGSLINSRMIEAYGSVDTIGQDLVTVVPSKLKKETITGATALEAPEEVAEHEPYPEMGFEEKYVTAKNKKFGKIISLTKEMIFFDQTNEILSRARAIGEGAAYKKEETIIHGVIDKDTDVYYPSDVATAVYSTTNGNLQSSNPFNAAGLAAVQKLAHSQQDDATDNKWILVSIFGKPALFPVDLMEEAWELSMGREHPETAERAENYWRGKFVPYTSPFITANHSTHWYWGDYKRAFWWLDVWPLQTFSAKAGHELEFSHDIVSRYKISYYGAICCVEPKFVYKSTA